MILPPVKQENNMDKLAYFLTGILTGAVSIVAAAFYFSDDVKGGGAKADVTKPESQKTSENKPDQQINPEEVYTKDILLDREENSESEQKIPTEPTVNPS